MMRDLDHFLTAKYIMPVQVSLNSNSAVFDDHFPNSPIIPAALLIEEIALQIERETAKVFDHASKLKLLAPAVPGEPLTLDWEERGEDLTFHCIQNNTAVLQGRLGSKSKPSQPISCPPAEMSPSSTSGCYERLPYGPRMQLIASVRGGNCDSDGEYAESRSHALELNPFCRSASLSAWSALEFAAQTLACHCLLNATNNDSRDTTREVKVVAIKSLQCFQSSFSAQEYAVTRIRLNVAHAAAARCEFELSHKDTLIARGMFTASF